MMLSSYRYMNVNGISKKAMLLFCRFHILVQVYLLNFICVLFATIIVLVCSSRMFFGYLAIVLVFSAAQSGRSSRRTMSSNEDSEPECGRLVGTVRRHMPIDTRDPVGAVIHFYLGDSFDSNWYAKFYNI
jgi:hypothetical protein